MQAFLGGINYYSRIIQIIAVYGEVLYQLKEDDFLSEENLVGGLILRYAAATNR